MIGNLGRLNAYWILLLTLNSDPDFVSLQPNGSRLSCERLPPESEERRPPATWERVNRSYQ